MDPPHGHIEWWKSVKIRNMMIIEALDPTLRRSHVEYAEMRSVLEMD